MKTNKNILPEDEHVSSRNLVPPPKKRTPSSEYPCYPGFPKGEEITDDDFLEDDPTDIGLEKADFEYREVYY